MTEPGASPFSEEKSNHWIWIIPSVLLHGVVLAVWLLLPEEEARKPGERELKIKPEQAEELREHVEEANLEELRKQVEELQNIKQAMARIREGEMERVAAFEQTMVQEAPQDIVGLLTELAAIYQSVQETYEGIEEVVDQFRKQIPPIRKAADADTIGGLRALKQLDPRLWSHFDGLYDTFEVAFYETGATMKAIEVKLEWVQDGVLEQRIESLKSPMEKTFEFHREAWSAIPYHWKRARSYEFLTENAEAHIETVQAFRKSETEGKAEVAEKRRELEQRIAETEAELARVDKALNADEAALKAIDKNKDRKAWDTRRGAIREHQNAQRALGNQLNQDRRELDRTQYKPDGRLAREVRRIEQRLEHALPAPPDRRVIDRAMKEQQSMIRKIETLVQSLEEAS